MNRPRCWGFLEASELPLAGALGTRRAGRWGSARRWMYMRKEELKTQGLDSSRAENQVLWWGVGRAELGD